MASRERDAPEDEVAALARRVAQNLKSLRGAKGWTLDELANRCGVSRATLSQIETCRTNPTLAVLWKIASGLEISFSELIGEDEPRPRLQLVSIREQDVIRTGDDTVESRPLAPGRLLGDTDLYELTLAPEATMDSEPHATGTFEALVVLEGAVRVTVEEESVVAETHQAVFFAADVAHRYTNEGSVPARALNVIVHGGR